MAEKQYDMSGALFGNSQKKKETHPDMTGEVLINGVKYYLSAWKKTSAKGQPYLSLSVKAEQEDKQSIQELLNSL